MTNFVVEKITRPRAKTLRELNELLSQWPPRGKELTMGNFQKLIEKSHLLALRDGSRIIGMVTLIEMRKISGLKGSVEHLIIDEEYRGRGLGKTLMKSAIQLAKKLKMEMVFLTCEPERIAANALYKKLGFRTKATNFYQLKLK